MNHKEQLEATRARVADENFMLLAEPLADAIAPLVASGKLSQVEGSKIMTDFFFNFKKKIQERDELRKRNFRL